MRLILASIVVFIALCGEAIACSCAPDAGDARTAVTAALERADMVFVGRIESQEEIGRKERSEWSEFIFQRTQFYVVDSWKGEKAIRVYVESNVTCCMCGFDFPRSGELLIYAFGPNENGYYATSICTRTKPLEAAKEDIDILNSLRAEDDSVKRSDRSTKERESTEREP